MSSAGRPRGPARRGHKKSKTGCLTCRRRHIRCDEGHPQCRNCVHHCCECVYGPITTNGHGHGHGHSNALGSSHHKDGGVQVKRLEEYPVINLAKVDVETKEERPKAALSLLDLPVNNKRLLYHISSISTQIEVCRSSDINIYLKRLPTLLSISFSYDFVMDALLSWSASHLAYTTQSEAALLAACQYRVAALKGLQSAVRQFSERNSDAVLAASILLSWLASDPDEWGTMLRGTSTVMSAMRHWQGASLLAGFIEEQAPFKAAPKVTPEQLIRQATPIPESQFPESVERASLRYIRSELRKVEPYVACRFRENRIIQYLISFTEMMEDEIPVEQPEPRFYLLEPLRSKLFWVPTLFIQESRKDPIVMITMAYLYAVALTVQPVFAAVGSAQFRSQACVPIETIHRDLKELHAANGFKDSTLVPLNLMKYPLEAVAFFRSRLGLADATSMSLGSLGDILIGLDMVSNIGIEEVKEDMVSNRGDEDKADVSPFWWLGTPQ